MNIEQKSIDLIKEHKKNPRKISAFKFEKLVESLLVFKEMLELRPIAINKEFIAIGGNQRLLALKKIKTLTKSKLTELLNNQIKFRRLSHEDQQAIIEDWILWQNNGLVPVVMTDFSIEQEMEFLVRDNVNFGEDDISIMKENYDVDMLASFMGRDNLAMYDYSEKINDSSIEKNPIKVVKLKCGYVETVLSEKEYGWIVEKLSSYIDENGSSNGFISHLLNSAK